MAVTENFTTHIMSYTTTWKESYDRKYHKGKISINNLLPSGWLHNFPFCCQKVAWFATTFIPFFAIFLVEHVLHVLPTRNSWGVWDLVTLQPGLVDQN